MKRKLLLGGAIAVAALLCGLLWAMREGANAAAPQAIADEPATPGEPAAPVTPRIPAPGRPARELPPPVPVPIAADRLATGPALGGRRLDDPNTIVSDHSGEPKVARRSPITPDTMFQVRTAITPIVKDCASHLAGLGKKGRATVVADIKIVGGKASTSAPVISVVDFEDEAFTACVAKAFSELVIDAPEAQADASYQIALPFPVP